MNINSMLQKISLFERLVVESGFLRDLQDYQKSMQQPQNRNLVFMKDVTGTIIEKLEELIDFSLSEELEKLIRKGKPFDVVFARDTLSALYSDTKIIESTYYTEFNTVVNKIFTELTANEKELSTLKDILSRYTPGTIGLECEEGQAFVSLIFKDLESTRSLKEFSKVLRKWNNTLAIYHQLLTSESHEEIDLTGIQEGSIDVIVNFNVDIAIDFTELVKTGLYTFSAYLLYKVKMKEIINAYMGNEELISGEKERDKQMLANIGESIERKLIEQHEESIANDDDIDTTGIDAKTKTVSNMIANHIIKGNEIKLLTPPKKEGDDIEQEDKESIIVEIEKQTAIVRQRIEHIDMETKRLLLESYSDNKEEE